MSERLIAAGWECEDERLGLWRLPGVTRTVTETAALKILDGQKCPAFLCHGPGHQSSADCELPGGDHDVHRTVVNGVVARWRHGAYTAACVRRASSSIRARIRRGSA